MRYKTRKGFADNLPMNLKKRKKKKSIHITQWFPAYAIKNYCGTI
jgi:hypothetical protein